VKDDTSGSRAAFPTALLALAACTVGSALFAAGVTSRAAKAATSPKKLTIYSVAKEAQFINHDDDRERALGHNPFNTDTSKLADKTKGNGPFAGDDTLYSFTLYTSADLKTKAGSAVYTCHYNFAKYALCTAYFELNGGTVVASGPVLFTSTSFTLAISGGTKKYFGVNGEVQMSSVTKNKQRLGFQLLS
jgi:hypothetical protein